MFVKWVAKGLQKRCKYRQETTPGGIGQRMLRAGAVQTEGLQKGLLNGFKY